MSCKKEAVGGTAAILLFERQNLKVMWLPISIKDKVLTNLEFIFIVIEIPEAFRLQAIGKIMTIATVRRICRSRRRAQRARGRASFADLRDQFAEACRNLGKAIK